MASYVAGLVPKSAHLSNQTGTQRIGEGMRLIKEHPDEG